MPSSSIFARSSITCTTNSSSVLCFIFTCIFIIRCSIEYSEVFSIERLCRIILGSATHKKRPFQASTLSLISRSSYPTKRLLEVRIYHHLEGRLCRNLIVNQSEILVVGTQELSIWSTSLFLCLNFYHCVRPFLI